MIYPALLFHALLCVALPCRPCHWLITHCTPTPASPLLRSNQVNSAKFIQVVQAVHIQYMWLLKSIVNCIFCFMRTTGIHDGKIAWGGAFEIWDIFWCLPHLFNPSIMTRFPLHGARYIESKPKFFFWDLKMQNWSESLKSRGVLNLLDITCIKVLSWFSIITRLFSIDRTLSGDLNSISFGKAMAIQ